LRDRADFRMRPRITPSNKLYNIKRGAGEEGEETCADTVPFAGLTSRMILSLHNCTPIRANLPRCNVLNNDLHLLRPVWLILDKVAKTLATSVLSSNSTIKSHRSVKMLARSPSTIWSEDTVILSLSEYTSSNFNAYFDEWKSRKVAINQYQCYILEFFGSGGRLKCEQRCVILLRQAFRQIN